MDHESRDALADMLPEDLAHVPDGELAETLAALEQRGLVYRLIADIPSRALVAAPRRPIADPTIEWWALTENGRAVAASGSE